MSAFTTVTLKISKTKRLTVRKKSARNLIYRPRRQHKNCLWSLSEAVEDETFWIFMNIFEPKTDVSFGFEADDAVASGCCLLRFSREHNSPVHLTFPLTEMYGYSRLCDGLRWSAITWKQLSLRSSAIISKPALTYTNSLGLCNLVSLVTFFSLVFFSVFCNC